MDQDIPPDIAPPTLLRQNSDNNHDICQDFQHCEQIIYGNKSVINKKKLLSKASVIRKALRQIIEYCEQIQQTGVEINITILLWNTKAKMWSTHNLEILLEISEFSYIEKISDMPAVIKPDGGTDFLCAIKAFKCIPEAENTISILLSDGRNGRTTNEIKNPTNENARLFDYGIGIGSASQVDNDLLHFLSKNTELLNDPDDLSDFILSSAFDHINIIGKMDISFAIIVQGNAVLTGIPFNCMQDVPECTELSPILVASVKNNKFIKIKVKDHEITATKPVDIIFAIDCSGSMNDVITKKEESVMLATEDSIFVIDDIENAKSVSFLEEEVETIPESPLLCKRYENKLEKITKKYEKQIFVSGWLPETKIFLEVKCVLEDGSETVTISEITDHIEISEFEEKLLNEIKKIDNGFNKLFKLEEISDKKTLIMEMHEYITSQEFCEKILEIEENCDLLSAEYIYLTTILLQIKNLFAASKSQADLYYAEMNFAPSLQRQISSQTCRQATGSMSRASTHLEYSEATIPTCILCQNPDKKRNVLFSCGHICACVECSKISLYGIEAYMQPALGGGGGGGVAVAFDAGGDEGGAVVAFNVGDGGEGGAAVDFDGGDGGDGGPGGAAVDFNAADELAFADAVLPPLPNLQIYHGVPLMRQHKNINKGCPVCRAHVTSLFELNVEERIDYKCSIETCSNNAVIISTECKHLIFCESCFNKKIRDKKNNGTPVICYCGVQIKHYAKGIFP